MEPAASLKSLWTALANRCIRPRLAGSNEFSFTANYCADHEAVWTTHLRPLMGTANLRLLEIGCFEGGATLWFLQNLLTHPGSAITCIDSFVRTGGEPRFAHNMRISGLAGKVTLIKGLSGPVMSRLDEQSYDVIYIDGSHRAADVMLDAVQAWLLLKRGGIVIFDDYAWEQRKSPEARPQLAIDAFLRAFDAHLDLLHRDYQVIVRKRPCAPVTTGQG